MASSRQSHSESKAPVRRRGQRTRARLLAAAQKVFERDGYLDARVADISAAARVAHGSFYTYFDSKEDIFRQIVESVAEDVYAALDLADEGTAAERISAANRRHIELYEQHATVLGLMEQVGNLAQFSELRRDMRRRSVERAEALIVRLAAEGETGAEALDPHVTATALVGMTDSFAYTWFVLGERFDRDTALANLDAVWLRTLGISTAPRRTRRRTRAAANSASR
jgi:AcrR family transcriptional regulator